MMKHNTLKNKLHLPLREEGNAILLKRALSLLIILVISISPAFALSDSQSYIPDDCGNTDCTCFIQLGDTGGFVKGIIKLLKEQGYLDKKAKTAQFTPEVEAAVLSFQNDNGLPLTGTMDDDTLTLLIWGILPNELDKVMPVQRYDPSTYPDMVYVPTDGGKKRHQDPECCDMYDPRKVSIRNAAALRYDACKICEVEREKLLH